MATRQQVFMLTVFSEQGFQINDWSGDGCKTAVEQAKWIVEEYVEGCERVKFTGYVIAIAIVADGQIEYCWDRVNGRCVP